VAARDVLGIRHVTISAWRALAVRSIIAGVQWAWVVLCLGGTTPGCKRLVPDPTQFLTACDGTCGAGYECIDGTCTLPCSDDPECFEALAGSTCLCVDRAVATCEQACLSDADCGNLSADHRCEGPVYARTCRAPNANDRYVVDELWRQSKNNNKLDLLLVIDNSLSMGDKQSLLSVELPKLVSRFANPACIDRDGGVTDTPSPYDPCPPGAFRSAIPIEDIHVGIISSSLGDAGANSTCVFSPDEPTTRERVDNGYLLGSLERGGRWQPGFLSWTGQESLEFADALQTQVTAVGERGCGYEASLEAWYRFLIDPTPWSGIDVVDCPGQAAGSGGCREPRIEVHDGVRGDPFILSQRRLFLRDDSLVAIVMVTDENDCSIAVGGQNHRMALKDERMFRGSDACTDDPNDACCYSCAEDPPENCADGCDADPTLTPEADPPNLRCYEQKRRFGADFLYPVERYVNALTESTLGTCSPSLDPNECPEAQRLPNPLFRARGDGPGRDQSLVFLAGIVGVPWQLIQAEADQYGWSYPSQELHFQSNQQLWDSHLGTPTWERLIGAPAVRDPHMLESVASRAVAPRAGLPTPSSGPGSDPIHGHEYFDVNGDDLQFSCIFPLAEPRDCDGPEFFDGSAPCDCRGAGEASYADGNPLCYSNGAYSSRQLAAKAYPSLRQLEVLRGFGDVTGNAIVSSICARNVDPSAGAQQDFGYNPASEALADAIAKLFYVDGYRRCWPHRVPLESIDGEERGKPLCSVVEAFQSNRECDCDTELGQIPLATAKESALRHDLQRSGWSGLSEDPAEFCLCELLPVGGSVGADGKVEVTDLAAYEDCQSNSETRETGWCYVDEVTPTITGDASLDEAKRGRVAECVGLENEVKRDFYFVGGGAPRDRTVFLVCPRSEPRETPP
jgi:hypothetical protein